MLEKLGLAISQAVILIDSRPENKFRLFITYLFLRFIDQPIKQYLSGSYIMFFILIFIIIALFIYLVKKAKKKRKHKYL